MKKNITYTTLGKRADIGQMVIYRLLPNSLQKMIGSFFFLDYLVPVLHSEDKPREEAGTGAHPHRGIATLSYILAGEDEHFDSAGNYAKVHTGGIQWMKAGRGIIHDETLNPDTFTNSRVTQGFQFWINLPSANKDDSPEYIAIQAKDVPFAEIDVNGSWLKVIVGEYMGLQSVIPDFQKQWLYHIHLAPKASFSLLPSKEEESAAVLVESSAQLNDSVIKSSKIVHFDNTPGEIEVFNFNNHFIDLLLFGGEPYTESVVAEGPFVMNTHQQIKQAYLDFHNNKYGTIDYSIKS